MDLLVGAVVALWSIRLLRRYARLLGPASLGVRIRMLWPYVAFVLFGLAFAANFFSATAGTTVFAVALVVGVVGGVATLIWAVRGTPTFIRQVRKGSDPASWRGQR